MPIYELSELPTPGGFPFSSPKRINDIGGICGFCQDSQNSVAIYWEKGSYQLLNLPGQPSEAFGININQDIVGNYFDPSPKNDPASFYGPLLPYVWNKNTGATIALNGWSGQPDYGSATDINNSGAIVGDVIQRFGDRDFNWSGLWSNSAATPINIGNFEAYSPSGIYGNGSSINENGFIAADSYPDDGFRHALIWDPGTQILKDIDGRYHYSSHANAINDLPSPQVVGWFDVAANEVHAFFYDGIHPSMHDLGIPGERSAAYDINNSGDVVGFAGKNAVLWNGFIRMDLNSVWISDAQAKGWDLVCATAINNKGQIVGYGSLHGDTYNVLPWLLTPTDELRIKLIPVEYMLPHFIWPDGAYDAPKPMGWPFGLPFPTPTPTPFQIVGSAYHRLNNILISKNILELTRSMSDEHERKELQKIAHNILKREMPKLISVLNNSRSEQTGK